MTASTRDLRRMMRRADRRVRRYGRKTWPLSNADRTLYGLAMHARDRYAAELEARGIDPWEHDVCPF